MSRNICMRPKDHKGFTLVELMVSTFVAGFLGLILSQMFVRPAQMEKMLLNIDSRQTANLAANQFVSDLQGATPTSIAWGTLPPSNPSYVNGIPTFSQVAYSMSNPGSPITTSVEYTFVPTYSGLGSLVRTVNGKSSTLLANVVAPTPDFPLVAQDTTTYNMLTFSFTYRPQGVNDPITVTRRVAVI